MKIAVLSYSGNVGKTTIARHLLAPRIDGCEVISVESINADAQQQGALRGDQYGALSDYLATIDAAVVDVGASNVEEFLDRMRQFRGSHEEFDYYIVPAVANMKQQEDTVATLDTLLDIGIQPERIRLVLNMVGRGDVESDFALVRAYAESRHPALFNPQCTISQNEVFERAKQSADGQIADLANDETDYKRLIAQTEDKSEKLVLAHRLGTKRLAQGVHPELEACFTSLALQ
jgi:hypothetical protein